MSGEEPELHSQGKGAVCYVERSVLPVLCVLVIVIGTEDARGVRSEEPLCSWDPQSEGKAGQQTRP